MTGRESWDLDSLAAVGYGAAGVTCPICNGTARLWRRKSGHTIAQCRSCRHGFVTDPPSVDDLVGMYEREGGIGAGDYTLEEALDEERRFPNSTVDAARIVGRCAHLTDSGRLLDIGCGQGFFSLAARDVGFEIDPIEFAPPERRVARELLGVDPEPSTFEELDRQDGSYSVVLMSQVLEHARDPVAWVEKAAGLLAPRGVLAVAVPSFDSALRRLLQDRDPFITPPMHLNFFTRRSLALLVERFGLGVRIVETVSKVPPQAYARLGPLKHLGSASTPFVLRPIDRVGLGMFLNLYGQARL